jgi:hypothetical protein
MTSGITGCSLLAEEPQFTAESREYPVRYPADLRASLDSHKREIKRQSLGDFNKAEARALDH